MDQIVNSLSTTENLLLIHTNPQSVVWLPLLMLLSAFCGSMIGMDREKRESAAGFRTLTLIALGACCYTISSVILSEGRGDPARVAAQLVTGIGFIGGGAIFKSDDTVKGVTTAASMWVVCAIGMIIGAGYPVFGVIITLLVHLILRARLLVAKMIFGPCRLSGWEINYDPNGGKTKIFLMEMLEEYDVAEFSFFEKESKTFLFVSYCTIHTFHRGFLSKVSQSPEVLSLEEKE